MAQMTLETKFLITTRDDIDAVAAAVGSGDLSGNADAVTAYETQLSIYFGTGHAVACSSGTAAIHLALLAHAVGRDDEVIVPSTAPAMTALPVLAIGARPVFVDVASTDTFAIDLNDLSRRVNSRTRAVISVPMWGYPADGADLAKFCLDKKLALIEDAAQAHGTTVSGKTVGTLGSIGTFSTHARKLVCTGEGGFCLTNDESLANILRRLRNLGQTHGAFGEAFGLNYKLSALGAALGTTQLSRLEARIATRSPTFQRLRDSLCAIPGLSIFPILPGSRANTYALLVTAKPPLARALGQDLAAHGILSDTIRYGYRPLYSAPVFAPFADGRRANAELLCASLVTLPCHEGVTEQDERRIVEICSSVVSSHA